MKSRWNLSGWKDRGMGWMRRRKDQPHFWFALFSAALILFDILCVYLCDRMDGKSMLAECVGWMLPLTAVFAAAGWLCVLLRRKTRWGKFVLVLPLIALVLVNLIISAVFLWIGTGIADLDVVEYGDDWDVLHGSKREAVRDLLSRCRLFGEGEEYYSYPDSALTDPDTPREIRQGAIRERSLAEAAFGEYRERTTNPVLCHAYGLWVHLLYTLLAAGWLGSCLLGSRKLGRIRKKLLFWCCGLAPLLFVCWILLGGYGIIPDQLARLFSLGPESASMMVMPQATAMWTMLKLEEGKEKNPCSLG